MVPVNNSSIRVANDQSARPATKPLMVTALSTSLGCRGKPCVYTVGEWRFWSGPLKTFVKESLPQSARTWLKSITVRRRVWLIVKPAKAFLNSVLFSFWILKSEEPLSNDTCRCVSWKTVNAFHPYCLWSVSRIIIGPWTLIWEFFIKPHYYKQDLFTETTDQRKTGLREKILREDLLYQNAQKVKGCLPA